MTGPSDRLLGALRGRLLGARRGRGRHRAGLVSVVPVGPGSGSLASAVRAARGRYLLFADPRDDVADAGVEAMTAALEESGSDLALADRRTARGRPWAAELFAERRLRATAEAAPLALLELDLSGKLFRRTAWQAWHEAGLGEPPAGTGAGGGPAIPLVLRALAGAEGFDVVPEVALHERPAEAALPVAEQSRFRADVVADRLDGLVAALTWAPAGWREQVVGRLLPALYVEAVGGGPDYLDALRTRLDPFLTGLDLERVPLGARLGAWAARYGTLEDVALVQDLLADQIEGLRTDNGLAVLPDGLSVEVPDPWRRVVSADRQVRTLVARRLVAHDEGCRVDGATFVEHVEQAPLPRVRLLRPGAPAEVAEVTRRTDARLNEWAARAWEDRSAAGWSAVLPSSELPGSEDTWLVEVSVEEATSHHPVRGPAPLADTLVEAVRLEDGALVLAGRTPHQRLRGRIGGGRTEGSVGASVEGSVGEGRFELRLDTVTTALGQRVRLPLGRYHVVLTVPRPSAEEAGTEVRAAWSGELVARPPEVLDDRLRVVPADGAGLAFWVRRPLAVAERGAFGQQRLRSAAARGGRRLEQTVLLETFRGRSVGDSPGAIGAELLARAPDLDLAWVVDDPAVPVPEGTRAVARGTERWYDAMAGARAYVANAGAPYWFRKPPGQLHLQTWHGTPLKRIGEDRGPGDFATWRHRRRIAAQAAGWDALVSPSPYCSRIFERAFGHPAPLLEVGQPRNDLLVRDDGSLRDRTRLRLGLDPADRVVLYAPTWRQYAGVRDSKPLYLDPERLVACVPDAVVLVRGHYNSTHQPDVFAGHDRVLDVTRYPDVADLFLAADALVTDYSSVMFDFALTDKPVVLLVPDLEQYRDVERGFYFDLEERAPGPMLRSTDDVAEALLGPDRHAAARAAFREEFCPYDDGGASARVVDHLLAHW